MGDRSSPSVGKTGSKRSGHDLHVLCRLSGSRGQGRAELVIYCGEHAVRKSYPPELAHRACREREILEKYGGICPEIPTLLASGDNYIIYPYYQNELHIYRAPDGILPRPLMPLAVAKRSMEVLRMLHEDGYALIDFHPGNVLYSRADGMKIIDFEYAQRCDVEALPFERCYALHGTPAEFPGEVPPSWPRARQPYSVKWEPYVGLSLKSLLHDREWKQHYNRFRFQCQRLVVVYVKRVLPASWYEAVRARYTRLADRRKRLSAGSEPA